jgi:hypothetical protein
VISSGSTTYHLPHVFLLVEQLTGVFDLLQKRLITKEWLRTRAEFTAYLYNEREVERAAWKKYGGLEGYELSMSFFTLQ